MNVAPKVNAFLVALATAEDDAFVVPPGLGGGWRAKHVKTGLERNVLTIHSSGQGFAFTPFTSKHGRCRECAGHRDVCTHCACEHCAFDRVCGEHNGPRATQAQVAVLRAKIDSFRFHQAPVVRLDSE